jgi:hypothetical protein
VVSGMPFFSANSKTHVWVVSCIPGPVFLPPIVFASQTRTVQSELPLMITDDSALKESEWMGCVWPVIDLIIRP